MPNVRRSSRSPRRAAPAPGRSIWPIVVLGLVVVVVFGRPPAAAPPLHWTVRDTTSWMSEFDGLRHQRALLVPRLADASGRMVIAEADLPPRDVPKQVPLDVAEPEMTGAVPPGARIAPKPVNDPLPVVNRGGKSDRLLSPQPFGRSTERDLFVRPTLATVPPSLDGWTPLVSIASLAAPQSNRVLPRRSLSAPRIGTAGDGRVIVAMVRTGPGRVVTQSAIAALGSEQHAAKARPVLPPVPDDRTAAANPRTRIWSQPAVPEIGYARRSADEVLERFRAVLGDEDGELPY
jgi:hypothetical protein